MSASLATTFPTPAESTPVSVPALARWACLLVMILGCFSGPLDIAEGTGGDTAARIARLPSVMLKLANAGAAGLIGLWGMLCWPKARTYLTSLPG